MFSFQNPTHRMDELGRFIDWWYGPRLPEHGEPVGDSSGMPDPLRQFIASAGRRTPLHPRPGVERFYSGSGGHHLLPLTDQGVMGGKLSFFMEYQGGWYGVTTFAGADPPVWKATEGRKPVAQEQLCDSLSALLVTHVLFVTLNAQENSYRSGSGIVASIPIWNPTGLALTEYTGTYGVSERGIVTHNSGRFAARDPFAIDYLRQFRVTFD